MKIANEMINPLFTAVIPVYNGEQHLRETLEHITQIECQEMELLLIDDGSSDRSSVICREFEACDGRIRYIRQKNQGIAASRNRGIELARGEYICFWDQDDLVIPEGYLALLHKMQAEHAQMGMCNTRRIIQGKTSDYESIRDGVYSGEEVRRKLLYPLLFRGYRYSFADTGDYLYGNVWKCIFRTGFVRDNHIQFKRFVNYEDDWIFVTQALCASDKVAAVSDAGYCWRVNEGSESHKKAYIKDLQKRFNALDQYVLSYMEGSIKEAGVLEEYRKVNLCEHYVDLFRNAASIRNAAGRENNSRRICYEHMREYLLSTDYKRQLTCRKYLKKAAYRRRVILNSLRYGGIKVTCVISRLYDRLETRMERVQWIVRMERHRKMGESN